MRISTSSNIDRMTLAERSIPGFVQLRFACDQDASNDLTMTMTVERARELHALLAIAIDDASGINLGARIDPATGRVEVGK